jgi:hypothetical protein
VSFVESNESESMKRLYVGFPFSVFSIEWVMVYPPNPAYTVAQIIATSTSTPTSATVPENKK